MTTLDSLQRMMEATDEAPGGGAQHRAGNPGRPCRVEEAELPLSGRERRQLCQTVIVLKINPGERVTSIGGKARANPRSAGSLRPLCTDGWRNAGRWA